MKRFICTLLMVAVSIQACGLLGGKPEPETITKAAYQPFSASYRGVGFGRTTQYFDDQPTETDFGLEFFVTVHVAALAGALSATLVLDSVVLFDGATGGITPAQVDSARGASFHASLADDGRLIEYGGGETSGSLARELSDRVLKPFFPIIPTGGAEPGATWSDTVETQIVANGIDNNVRLISEHVATEWALHAGMRALRIVTLTTYDFIGSGSQSGRAFTIEGHGRRHLHRYVSESGRYLGLVSADTSDGEARITDMDIVIPIHQTRVDSLVIR